jgi:hypothetical protein
MVNGECRTENISGSPCARSHVFTFASLAKAATAVQQKWNRLRFYNRCSKLTTREARLALPCTVQGR